MYFPRCVSPVTIFRDKVHHLDPLSVPCGKCVACRMRRANVWALRCMMEFESCGNKGCFLTLTYDEDSCPVGLRKDDLQRFFKRFRHTVGRFRYLACGEYGDQFFRPHYHIILFGIDFDHPIFNLFKPCANGRRGMLADWAFGFTHVGCILPERCVYVAKYTIKKYHITYSNLPDPFLLMSRRPGLGHFYILNHIDEIRSGKDHLLGFHSISDSDLPSLPRAVRDMCDKFEDLYSFDGKDRIRAVRREIERGLQFAHFELENRRNAAERGMDVEEFIRRQNLQRERDLSSTCRMKGKL